MLFREEKGCKAEKGHGVFCLFMIIFIIQGPSSTLTAQIIRPTDICVYQIDFGPRGEREEGKEEGVLVTSTLSYPLSLPTYLQLAAKAGWRMFNKKERSMVD